MAEGTLSHPFRITPQGHAAVAPYGSDQAIEESIAVLTLTMTGERTLEPSYGVPDPVFAGLDATTIQTGVDSFGPEGVEITSVEEEPISESHARYTVNWTREDDEETDGGPA
ncbi:hypothetical protein [Nesterenkonia rhizosphaerae]|uniref:Halobacterial output domain-containing protein n=1 Tax=Nesterenkonia rhizosphaerae TaxID=1348272 RepID=A0ABP9FWH4_9MICC